MATKTAHIVLLLLIFAGFAAGGILYEQLPDRVASHWDARGRVDGYMGKFWGVFLLPIIMAGLFAVYIIIPRVDPLKSNIAVFRKYYDVFWIFLFVFFLYILGLVLAWNIGYKFNISTAIIPAIAAFWYIIGIVLSKSKRNWFLGIRTPWTLSSDIVWDKTHKLGGRLFKAAAILSLMGLFVRDDIAIAVIVIPAVAVSVITVAYSYIVYRKLEQE